MNVSFDRIPRQGSLDLQVMTKMFDVHLPIHGPILLERNFLLPAVPLTLTEIQELITKDRYSIEPPNCNVIL